VHDVAILAAKGAAAGLLVVGFALLSEGLSPKRFAGLFSAAPAVAIAGLALMLLDKGSHDARQNATGMIAGGAAIVFLLRRFTATAAAAVGLVAWAAAAAAISVPLLVA
jgi:hypothetical protein